MYLGSKSGLWVSYCNKWVLHRASLRLAFKFCSWICYNEAIFDLLLESGVMMRLLQPDLILESVFAIDFNLLQTRGIKGLLIDLDNTIVPWEDSHMGEEFYRWVQEVKNKGFLLCLVTNALENRTTYFAEHLDIPAVGRAWKPLNRAFTRGLQELQLPPEQVGVVGDQMFTDVLGGNRLGLFTILVNPLSTQELRTTKLVRKFENLVLKKLVQQGKLTKQELKIRGGER